MRKRRRTWRDYKEMEDNWSWEKTVGCVEDSLEEVITRSHASHAAGLGSIGGFTEITDEDIDSLFN